MDSEFDKDDDKISNSSLMDFESEKNKKEGLSEQPSGNPKKNSTSK